MPKMSAQDLRWQAESDASTMVRYEETMNDSARKRRAMAEARRQAQDLNKRAAAMQRAASSKTSRRK